MASLGELGLLTETEYADLSDRVDRFHATWAADRPADPAAFLPPASARHRAFVLVELLKTEMELRARAGEPVRVEPYLARFRADLPADAVPVSLLAEEYRLRHRYGDKPSLDEYKARFPAEFPALSAVLLNEAGLIAASGVAVGPPAPDRTTSTPVPDAGDSTRGSDAVHYARARDRSAPPAAAGPLPPASDVIPSGLQYRLIRRLGAGAFGEVYEAEAPGGFRVAVKKILRGVDHPASQGEIESLEAIKAISHPFLLQTQAYWVFEDRLVIVMELADGSLADRIEHHKKQGRPGVPPEELIPFFEQVAEALDYLHAQSVSHRDVKPQNLLHLKGYAKVADFGLARGHAHTLTNVGMEVGTPVYMAPEVWRQTVSLHSDQYSLAASYVQARLGRPPFTAKTLPELCFQHLEEAPNLGSLPEAEQKVLLKALAKKPTDRYPSCLAFAKALREAVLAPPPPPPQPPPPSRWGPVALALAAALVCGITVGGVIWYLQPPPTPVGGTTPTQPEPPRKIIPVPRGWEPDESHSTVVLPGGRELYNRLTHTVGDTKLVAILITSTQPGDPQEFYMLENKITNRVFAAVWDGMEKNPLSRLHQIRKLDPDRDYLPGTWKQGAISREGQPLGIVGDYADVPVVGVTVIEALLVAEELGGRLPMRAQWLKAVGANERDRGDRPAGMNATPGEGLAINVSEPWKVTRRTKDVSRFGIHQLLTNGYEWLGERDDGSRLNLIGFADLPIDVHARVVGQGWEKPTPLTSYSDLHSLKESKWTDTDGMYGFRIVLEPR